MVYGEGDLVCGNAVWPASSNFCGAGIVGTRADSVGTCSSVCSDEVQRGCVLSASQVPQGALLRAFPYQEEGYDCVPVQGSAD